MNTAEFDRKKMIVQTQTSGINDITWMTNGSPGTSDKTGFMDLLRRMFEMFIISEWR